MIIESLGVYLPPHAVSTDEVLRACKKQLLVPLEQLTGIRSRRVCGEGEFAIDLARRAVAGCFAASRHDPGDVDLIVCCNISRYDGPDIRVSFEPSTAVQLKKHFGCDRAVAFDLSNACAGMFTG